MTRLLVVLVTVVLAGGALFMAGRSDEGSGPPSGAATQNGADSSSQDPSRGASANGSSDDSPAPSGSPPRLRLPPSSCEPGLDNCVVASGTVIYVEAVDPDGDGDAHFVTTSKESVTLPGITVFDVRTDLRPEPLPEVGDLVGGAGPVFRGSRGQNQIQVTEFHVAR